MAGGNVWRPMAMLRRTSLRARMAMLVLTGGLPLLVYNLGSVYASYREDREHASHQALDLARVLALAVEGELGTRIAILEVLAGSHPLAAGDLDTFRAQAEVVLGRQGPSASIALLRQDGQQVMNTAVPPGAPLPVRQNRENHDRVLQTGLPSVSDFYPGVVARRLIVAIEVPVRQPDGSIGLILAMAPSLAVFDKVIVRQVPNERWIITILDRKGIGLARVPGVDYLVDQPAPADFLQAWMTQRETITETIAPDGTPVISAFSPLSEIGWTVAVAVPITELTGPAWRSALTSLGVGLALLVLGLLAAHWISHGVTVPIELLRRLASGADGIETPPLATGLPETDEVALALRNEARLRVGATASLLESERRLRLVIAEMNHRAKNALVTVQALAMQTARGAAGTDPAHFVADFSGRLRTLARAHDLLMTSAWGPAGLDEVLRAGLAPWLDPSMAPAQSLILRDLGGFAPTLVSPNQAQALVMAMHELATNATKHGALSRPDGRVVVTYRAGECGHGALIEWRESGGPPLSARPARKGFGTRLLEQALPSDLGPGASVVQDFTPSGLHATIRFFERSVGSRRNESVAPAARRQNA